MYQILETINILKLKNFPRSVQENLEIVREHMSRYKVPWAFLEENKPPIQKC